MRRREFIALLGGAATAWPLAVSAQQPAMPEIGFLAGYSPSGSGLQRLAAFKRSLAEAGFVDSKNVAIAIRWAKGRYDQLPAMATELVRRQVKVIVTNSTPAALAAKAATTTIPIVFALASDPVALGLVANLARPGGNCTGVTRLHVELGSKKLQLMHEIVPSATSMALLVNPTNPAIGESERRQVEAAAHALGVELRVLEANDAHGIGDAFATAIKLGVGALIIAPDGFFNDQNNQLAALTIQHRMPAIFGRREFVSAGGLISYSGSLDESYHIVGAYAGRILKGEQPANLPVHQSTKLEMFINLKTAKALNIAIPQGLVVMADEVIE